MSADRAYEQRSMKAQMKAANRSGADFAVIVGTDEIESGTVTPRPLRGDGEQVAVRRDSLTAELQQRLH